MLLARIVSLTARPLPFIRSSQYRTLCFIPRFPTVFRMRYNTVDACNYWPGYSQFLSIYNVMSNGKTDTSNSTSREMGFEDLHSDVKKCVNLRLCNVSGCMTEILEICADNPSFHVVFVPGNPGIITFYKEFVESLFELLGGTASVSAVGHAGQTEKNWEHGKMFSLHEQIDHKLEFIRVQNIEVPLVLVGHSIGSYISLEILRRLPNKAVYCIGLYPFLALNLQSKKQSTIVKIAMSRVLSTILSFLVASLGLLPRQVLRLIFKHSVGKSWSNTALEAACSHLCQYHTMRNVLFMAMSEFRKLSETPDWEFMRKKQDKITFLYGIDDHWGPLQMFEEISKQASDIGLSIEREGHTHSFCCTEAGSWLSIIDRSEPEEPYATCNGI